MEQTNPTLPRSVAFDDADLYQPIQEPVLSIAHSLSGSNLDQQEDVQSLDDREIISIAPNRFDIVSAKIRKTTTIFLVICLICAFIPGVNLAFLAKFIIAVTAFLLFAAIANAVDRCKYESLPAKEKATLIFKEAVKFMIAPISLIYDSYKFRKRNIELNNRVLGSESI